MKKLFPFVLTLVAVAMLTGCATEPKTEDAKENLRDDVNSTLNRFKREDPGLNDFLTRAHGYVLFPSVGKGGLGVGGAYGRGEVYEQGQFIGYADLTQASIGLQAGGQEYSELIAFETRDSFNKFKQNNFAFAANASAVALKAGASAAAPYRNGVAVFTMAKGGLMFEASIGGQKFNFKPADQNSTNMGTTTHTETTRTETRTESGNDSGVRVHGEVDTNGK